LVGVFMNDELPSKLIYGNYIVNLEDSDKDGSHWCCFILTKDTNIYFDPFGEYPSKEVEGHIKKYYHKVFYNHTDIQPFDSVLCGFYCIGLFAYMKNSKKGKTFLQNVNDYINLFNKVNNKNNDAILINYFKNI